MIIKWPERCSLVMLLHAFIHETKICIALCGDDKVATRSGGERKEAKILLKSNHDTDKSIRQNLISVFMKKLRQKKPKSKKRIVWLCIRETNEVDFLILDIWGWLSCRSMKKSFFRFLQFCFTKQCYKIKLHRLKNFTFFGSNYFVSAHYKCWILVAIVRLVFMACIEHSFVLFAEVFSVPITILYLHNGYVQKI